MKSERSIKLAFFVYPFFEFDSSDVKFVVYLVVYGYFWTNSRSLV